MDRTRRVYGGVIRSSRIRLGGEGSRSTMYHVGVALGFLTLLKTLRVPRRFEMTNTISMREKILTVYILANERNTVVYVGVTSRFPDRIWEHKEKIVSGFTKQYNVTKLVYYEITKNPDAAIAREKEIKAWRREKKNRLIHTINPDWRDLYDDLL